MAITVDQVATITTGDNVSSLTSASGAWGSNLGSGKTIVLVVYGYDSDGTGLTFGATWSAGGTFTEATSVVLSESNNRFRVTCFYLHNAAGSGTKPTVTVTPSQAAFINFAMLEVSGLAAEAEHTENTNATSSSTTTPAAGAITTTEADCLLVLGYTGPDGGTQTHTAPTNFTEFGEQTDNTNHQAGSCAYRIVTATQSAYNPAWTTTNGGYAATITAFKMAAAGGGTANAAYYRQQMAAAAL